jgi:hypothetical protein
LYKWAYNNVPKQRSKYIKYITKPKGKKKWISAAKLLMKV